MLIFTKIYIYFRYTAKYLHRLIYHSLHFKMQLLNIFIAKMKTYNGDIIFSILLTTEIHTEITEIIKKIIL